MVEALPALNIPAARNIGTSIIDDPIMSVEIAQPIALPIDDSTDVELSTDEVLIDEELQNTIQPSGRS